MDIVGYCRFSWFGISDTGRAIKDLEVARSVLWNPRRMAVRFHLFEKIHLPSLLAQSDQNFKFYFIISEQMPAVYKERLAFLIAGHENLEILSTTEQHIGHVLAPKLSESVESHDKAVHFRLDDDDALAGGFIAKIRSLMAAHDFPEGSAISFPKGFCLFYDKGVAKHVPVMKNLNAYGLSFVAGKTKAINPFLVRHRRIAGRMPTFTDPSFPAYTMIKHLMNNTAGYGASLETRRENRVKASKHAKGHDYLAQGEVVHPNVEKEIKRAGFGSTGAQMRKALEEAFYPEKIAKDLGFS